MLQYYAMLCYATITYVSFEHFILFYWKNAYGKSYDDSRESFTILTNAVIKKTKVGVLKILSLILLAQQCEHQRCQDEHCPGQNKWAYEFCLTYKFYTFIGRLF